MSTDEIAGTLNATFNTKMKLLYIANRSLTSKIVDLSTSTTFCHQLLRYRGHFFLAEMIQDVFGVRVIPILAEHPVPYRIRHLSLATDDDKTSGTYQKISCNVGGYMLCDVNISYLCITFSIVMNELFSTLKN